MTGEAGYVTVFRSADRTAEDDATAIKNLLIRNDIDARLIDDNTPGVESGAFEVRVHPDQAEAAEELIAVAEANERGADPSADLDMVTLRRTMGATGEMEALSIKSILDANGITSMIFGASTLPNLSFFVRVPASSLEAAERVLAEAEAAGPAAALEAQRESEPGNNP